MSTTDSVVSVVRDELAEQALGSILGANPFIRFDPTEMARSATSLVGRAALRPGMLGRHAAKVVEALTEVAVGASQAAPAKGDRRFTDATWEENPAFRRLMQGYLVLSEEARRVLDDVPMSEDERIRAEFLVENLVQALAPSNLPLTNPAVYKRTLETAGGNALRGVQHALDDLVHNGGMPAQVDPTPFVVGETVAISKGAVVHRDERVELIRYAPTTEQVHATPLVVIPPQINKFYILDIAPGRSLVEYLTGQGQQVFVLSWRDPTPADRDWDLDQYVASAEQALRVARDLAGVDRVNVLGACAGGITTAVLAGHLAATGEELIGALTFLVTVLDTRVSSTMSMFAGERSVARAIRRSRRRGVLRGRDLARTFAWLRPNDLVWNYWVNNYLLGHSPPAFDVLAWNADTTNLPADLHRDFLSIFVDNMLVTPGAWSVMDSPVDLGKVDVDAYVVGALTDHITPWTACYRTTSLLGGDTQFVLSSSGHIQAIVNPPDNPKARYHTSDELPEDAEEWLASADTHAGSWWEHWAEWLQARSGPLVDAPEQPGSDDRPVLADAPGTYVTGA